MGTREGLAKSRARSTRETAGRVLRSTSGRTTIVKVRVAGGRRERVEKFSEPTKPSKSPRQESNAATLEEINQLFKKAQVLAPPEDPRALCELYEETAILRPNVDAYTTNIDGHGHHFKPMLDVKGDDAFDKVFDAMCLDRMLKQEAGMVLSGDAEPSNEEVEKQILDVARSMRIEQFRLQSFFSSCVIGESFISLRRRTRQDVEVTGNGYWEVLRRESSPQVAQFVYLHSYTMRLLPTDEEQVEVEIPIRVGPLEWGTEKVRRRFRRFLQITDMGRQTFFKEFGDPRVMSAKTGNFYGIGPAALARLKEADGENARIATEVLHFKIPSPRSPYGVPRWIGALYAVLGTAKVDEINYLYFDNKAVPPLALFVTGGKLGEDAVEKIEDFIEDELKGADNFHKILIIEAESPKGMEGENNGRMKIELKPLTDAQQKDGLFMKYEERNTDRVGMSFRVPRLLRGDVRDFNRATSESALKFTESQVFGPERNEFDHLINSTILPTLGIRYWNFVSNAVQITNPEDMSKVIAELAKAGVLWPSLAVELLSEFVFNRELPIPDADWADKPVILTQTEKREANAGSTPTGAEDPSESNNAGALRKTPAAKALMRTRAKYGKERTRELAGFAHQLLEMQSQLAKAETDGAREEFMEAKLEEEEETGHAPPNSALETRTIRLPLKAMVEKLGFVPEGEETPKPRRRRAVV